MPSPARILFMPFDEYLELEAKSDTKHEWINGLIYAMSRGTPEHGRLSAAIVRALPQTAERRVYSSDTLLYICETENSNLIDSGNSDHSGAPSGTRGPSIAPTRRRGEARNDRHGQKARNPGAAKRRAQPGRDGRAGRRLAKQASNASRLSRRSRASTRRPSARGGNRPAIQGRAVPQLPRQRVVAQPDVLAVELLRRARRKGYEGGKSALYELVKELRPERRGRLFGSRASPASSRSTTSGTSTCDSSMDG